MCKGKEENLGRKKRSERQEGGGRKRGMEGEGTKEEGRKIKEVMKREREGGEGRMNGREKGMERGKEEEE